MQPYLSQSTIYSQADTSLQAHAVSTTLDCDIDNSQFVLPVPKVIPPFVISKK